MYMWLYLNLCWFKSSNNDLISPQSTRFYFDYQDGKYGFNTNSSRGADTFIPFNTSSLPDTVTISLSNYIRYNNSYSFPYIGYNYANLTIKFTNSDTMVFHAVYINGGYNSIGVGTLTKNSITVSSGLLITISQNRQEPSSCSVTIVFYN